MSTCGRSHRGPGFQPAKIEEIAARGNPSGVPEWRLRAALLRGSLRVAWPLGQPPTTTPREKVAFRVNAFY